MCLGEVSHLGFGSRVRVSVPHLYGEHSGAIVAEALRRRGVDTPSAKRKTHTYTVKAEDDQRDAPQIILDANAPGQSHFLFVFLFFFVRQFKDLSVNRTHNEALKTRANPSG